MMARPVVLLCYPKIDHEKDYVYYWMPYSLLTTAQPLLGQDLHVEVFDGNLDDESVWMRLLQSHRDNLLCIGISIMTGGGQIGHALRLASVAKQVVRSAPLVFGGPHVNVLPEQTSRHELVNAVLTGPGQTSLPRYVDALRGRCAIDAVPGLMINDGDTSIVGPQNPPHVELLGHYPWQLIDVESYVRNDPTVSERTLNYVSSQGCVYKCRFCYELTYQCQYSAVPAESLLEDVRLLVSSFAVDGIKFYDADFFINLKRVLGFVTGLVEAGPSIAWAASVNPKDLQRAQRRHPELLGLLKASGCSRLLMGVESGSDRVLRDIVRKEITRGEILDVAKDIANHGILGSYTFIVGFPGETESEQDETYRFIEEIRKLRPQPETRVHVFAPYPGTPLFQAAIEHGFIPPTSLEAWSSYDYYDSQTPWTSDATVARARGGTQMRLSPTGPKPSAQRSLV